jgi:vancomycin permeability regulator SanA
METLLLEKDKLDEGIKEAVFILRKHGFDTFESCESSEGHCFREPTIRFFGSEFDLIRAYEICKLHDLDVYEAKRVYRKVDAHSLHRGLPPCALTEIFSFNVIACIAICVIVIDILLDAVPW